MQAKFLILSFAILVITACAAEPGVPLTVSDVRLFAPLAKGHAAVGYLTLHNQSNAPLTIERISSTNFGNIQMHETVIRDGVARMQALPAVIIEPGSSLKFAAGGKHLMLMQPTANTTAGANITLEIHYASGGLLIVSATLQERTPTE